MKTREICLYEIPLVLGKVSAGTGYIPTDYIDKYLTFDSNLIKNPEATFCVKVIGDSMKDASIFDGDQLLVDTSIEVTSGKIVIARLEDKFLVKKLSLEKDSIQLLSFNENFPVIVINTTDFEIIGVVITIIRNL